MATGIFAWLGFIFFLFQYKIKNVYLFPSGCFYMVNISQNCYTWLSLLEGLRGDLETPFHCLPSLVKEWEFQPQLPLGAQPL